jgi:ABC-type amino acid transport substrate-binding protein
MKSIRTTQTGTPAKGGIFGRINGRKLRKVLVFLAVMSLMAVVLGVTASAAAPPAAPAGGGGAEATYQTVIQFFITWLTRIGMLVGLVGAIMFALAIKSNDAEQKQAGLLTMVAGFVVAAVCGAADMFNLFA